MSHEAQCQDIKAAKNTDEIMGILCAVVGYQHADLIKTAIIKAQSICSKPECQANEKSAYIVDESLGFK